MKHHFLGVILVGVVSSAVGANLTASKATTNCPCGWGPKERIVGGKEAKANAYAFVVPLVINGMQFCGSAILTKIHLITAGHCTFEMHLYIQNISAVVGAHDISKAPSSNFIPIKSMIEHEDYNYNGMTAHDLSIITLAKPLRFTHDIGPICLPNRRFLMENKFVRVLGWGMTTNGGELSPTLMEVNLRIIPWKTCQKTYPLQLLRPQTQICTYGDNKDSCQGDSGGPVIAIDTEINRYVLVGMVSFGKACGSENPAVNTDISRYLPWIRSMISKKKTGVETCSKVNARKSGKSYYY